MSAVSVLRLCGASPGPGSPEPVLGVLNWARMVGGGTGRKDSGLPCHTGWVTRLNWRFDAEIRKAKQSAGGSGCLSAPVWSTYCWLFRCVAGGIIIVAQIRASASCWACARGRCTHSAHTLHTTLVCTFENEGQRRTEGHPVPVGGF
jgi:hypothetical protein